MSVSPPTRPPDVKARPRRCLDCGYVIDGLTSSTCPECGRAFDLSNPSSYTTKPPLVRWRLWLPGLATGLIGGLLVFAIIEFAIGARGFGMWIGIPFAISAIACYGLRHAGYVLALFSVAVCLVGMIIGIGLLGAAGVFCAIILLGVFVVPIIFGGATGYLLRVLLKGSRFSQRHHLPVLALLAIPVVITLIEIQFDTSTHETVKTSHVIDAPIETAWDAMMFYEEVTHDPPWILRVGLARPLRTVGSATAPGDVKTCYYNKGRITKRTTAVESHVRLDFVITEQQIGYERDVRLIGGSFIFEVVDDDRTRVTLVTSYEGFNGPRLAWRPAERWAAHLLHTHVLEGMEHEALRAVEDVAWEIRDDHPYDG